MILPFVLTMAVAVTTLIVAERKGWTRVGVVSKLIASAGFIAIWSVNNQLGHPVALYILFALMLCFVGDAVLLMGSKRWAFPSALGVFLIAHLVYALSFDLWAGRFLVTAAIFGVLTVPAVVVGRWLAPHVAAKMQIPVAIYILAISFMFASALSAAWEGVIWLVPAGAFLVYASDLAVARHEFVEPSWRNHAVGLPLYYAGQAMIAASVWYLEPVL